LASKSPIILSDQQRQELGRIPEDLTDLDIGRYYTLNQEELWAVKNRRTADDRLGFAVQLGVLHFPGIPWRDLPGIPDRVLTYLASQIDEAPEAILDYAQRYQTGDDHLKEIRALFQYRPWDGLALYYLTHQLLPRAMESDYSLWLMEEALTLLRRQRILVPAISTVEAAVWNVQRIAEARIEKRLLAVLSAEQQAALAQVVKKDAALSGKTRFAWLRRPAKKPSSRSVKQMALRVEWLRKLNLPPLPTTVPAQRLHVMARRCGRFKAASLDALENKRRQKALLCCFLSYWQRELIDLSVELIHQMWLDVRRLAKRTQDKHILTNAKTLQRNFRILADAVGEFLRAEVEKLDPYQTVYQVATREELEAAIASGLPVLRPADLNPDDLMAERYEKVRYAWLKWFSVLQMRAVSGYSPCLDALNHVVLLRKRKQRVTALSQRLSKKQVVQAPVNHLTTPRWRKLALDKLNIRPSFYELAAWEALDAGIHSGEIAIDGSLSYRAFETYMLPLRKWHQLRDSGQTRLAITGSARDYLDERREQYYALLPGVLDQLRPGGTITVDKQAEFHLAALEKSVSATAEQIQAHVSKYLPEVAISEVCWDVATWTGWFRSFTRLDTGESVTQEHLPILIAVILALGMNISLSNMAQATPFTRSQLAAIAALYIREETLSTVQTLVNQFIFQQPLAQLWGQATSVSSDAIRIPVAVNSAHAVYNPHFLGTRRGVSLQTTVLDYWPPLGQQLINPNLREGLYSLDMLEAHQSEYNIFEHYADTHGYTYQVFGFSLALGYYFAPRIRSLFKQSLFALPGIRPPESLAALFSRPIYEEVVVSQWDEFLRAAASMRHGVVVPSLLMRKLANYPRRSRLYQAVTEIGKIEKTLFILHLLGDPAFQRGQLIGLNKGESVQGTARVLFSSRRGELYAYTLEAQAYRTSCLMLLVSLLCSWNTVYLGQAREYMATIGEPTDDEYWRHVSPARWKHINLIGYFNFDFTDLYPLNRLRPIRLQPELPDDEMD